MEETSGLYFIDTNVAVYAAGASSEHKQACLDLLEAVAQQHLAAVTDAEVMQELVHHYHRRGQLAAGGVFIQRFCELVLEVYPVGPEDVAAAMNLLLRHPILDARDAIHWAVMRRNGVSHVITADRHFSDLPGIVRVDPRELDL